MGGPTIRTAEIDSYLLQTGLVNPQMLQLIDSSGGVATLEATLDQLEQQFAPWASLEDQLPDSALTAFQRKQIEATCRGKNPFPGVRVGNYTLMERLGSGGQARVYRAVEFNPRSPMTGPVRYRVIKFPRPDDERVMDREARILSRLGISSSSQSGAGKDHRFGIAEFYGEGNHHGAPYIATSFSPGSDLSKYITKHGPLDVGAAVTVMILLLEALRHAHQNEVLHRDLKPANIIINKSSSRISLTVIDWGLGKVLADDSGYDPFESEDKYTKTNATIGTLNWMSPEHFAEASQITQESDVYSAGLILYALLTSKPPFEGKSLRNQVHDHCWAKRPTIADRYREIHHKSLDFPTHLEDLAQQMLAVDAVDRPSIDDCIQCLVSADRISAKAGPSNTGPAGSDRRQSVHSPLSGPRQHDRASPASDLKAPERTINARSQREPNPPAPSTDNGLDHDSAIGKADTKTSENTKIAFRPRSEEPDRSEPLYVNLEWSKSGRFGLSTIVDFQDSKLNDSETVASLISARNHYESSHSRKQAYRLFALACEKEEQMYWDGAHQQLSEAWQYAPGDVAIKRRLLSLQKRLITSQSLTAKLSSLPAPTHALKVGDLKTVFHSTSDKLLRSPNQLGPLWLEAQALDLLGYWDSCLAIFEHLTGLMTHISTNASIDILLAGGFVALKSGQPHQQNAWTARAVDLKPSLIQTDQFRRYQKRLSAERTAYEIARKSRSRESVS